MPARVMMFAVVTLMPFPLLVSGIIWGGVWIFVAFAYLTVFTFTLDKLVVIVSDPANTQTEFPAATILLVVLACAHFVLLALAILGLTGGTGLAIWERVVGFFACGLFFGQVSNSNAHELIHRSPKWLHTLGEWVFISHLFGHHTSAHPKVHHRYVGTDNDPNSAKPGEPYYQYLGRAWLGSFSRGLEMETKALQRSQGHWLKHPYLIYIAGGVMFISLAATIAGVPGVLAYFALAGYATAQLLLSDYVQHYGLRRKKLTGGQFEPVGPQHSWNAPHWFSTYLMLAAPRHSDHHSHPSKPYGALQLPNADAAPMLPFSIPVMGFIALNPRRWKQIMDPRVAVWTQAANTEN